MITEEDKLQLKNSVKRCILKTDANDETCDEEAEALTSQILKGLNELIKEQHERKTKKQ